MSVYQAGVFSSLCFAKLVAGGVVGASLPSQKVTVSAAPIRRKLLERRESSISVHRSSQSSSYAAPQRAPRRLIRVRRRAKPPRRPAHRMNKVTGSLRQQAGLLKTGWYSLAVLCVVQLIVASAVAAANANTANGYKSASFAAVWGLFLVLLFQYMSAYVIFYKKSTALFVGFVIGTGFMTSELFFMLMCVFFLIGTEAETINPGAAVDSDKAYGSFAFFNMIAYFIWTLLLTKHRADFIVSETGDDDGPDKEPIDESENYNPNQGAEGDEQYDDESNAL